MPYIRARGTGRALQRDRPWFLMGGSGLAAVAGFVNVCVLAVAVVPVSHVSGAVSVLSIDVYDHGFSGLGLTGAVVIGFVIGAVVSGAVIGASHLRPGRRYGVTLILEGALLAVATVLLIDGRISGVAVAAVACGVQNAMASSYYGLVIRTTHMTGIVTDIGVLIGHWLRHRRISLWKLGFLTSLFVSFFAGGIAAAVAVRFVGVAALAAPAALCLTGGGVYYVWRHRALAAR